MPPDLQDRLIEFAASTMLAARCMPRDVRGRAIAEHLMRACSSPAANYAEARESVSNKEYVFKMQLCLRELRETMVWLRIAQRIGYGNADYSALIAECNELTAICVACAKKAKQRVAQGG